MCEKLDGLEDVGEDGFWDTTGIVSSGKYKGEEYVFHEEQAKDRAPNEEKVCILDAVQSSPILGDICFKCAKTIFLKKKANLNSTH